MWSWLPPYNNRTRTPVSLAFSSIKPQQNLEATSTILTFPSDMTAREFARSSIVKEHLSLRSGKMISPFHLT